MSRGRDIATGLSVSLASGTLSASGIDVGPDSAAISSIIIADVDNAFVTDLGIGGGGSGVTAYSYDSSGGLLLESTTSHTDGSLHWLGALNEKYVWDSAAEKYYAADDLAGLAIGEFAQTLRGTVAGYTTGGYPTNSSFDIQKYSFTSDGNGTEPGDLVYNLQDHAGTSSATHGYTLGGGTNYTGPSTIDEVDKFSFATDANATQTADVMPSRKRNQAASHNGEFCVILGGQNQSTTKQNTIDKFTFATEAASNLSPDDLGFARTQATGTGSGTHAYSLGGSNPSGQSNDIIKYSFAGGSDASDVANLVYNMTQSNGHSSETHGYSSGGANPSTRNYIFKHSFATDANASDIGDITISRFFKSAQGANSTTHGYDAGGGWPYKNTIDKFPFSADTNSTDVGDLNAGGSYGMSHHNY